MTFLSHQAEAKHVEHLTQQKGAQLRALVCSAWRGGGSEETQLQFATRTGTMKKTEPDSLRHAVKGQ